MIRVILGEDLKTEIDEVCTSCGRDHGPRSGYEEGIDFVYETDDSDDDGEWCICMDCKILHDNKD